ncbi:hypothetical protein Tco_1165019 [Tanacetum coccineum]
MLEGKLVLVSDHEKPLMNIDGQATAMESFPCLLDTFGTPNPSTNAAYVGTNDTPSNNGDDSSVNVKSAKTNGLGHVSYANLLNGELSKKVPNFRTLFASSGSGLMLPYPSISPRDDLPEVKPVQPDIAPVIPEPALLADEHVLLDEDEDPEKDPKEEPKEKEGFDEDMDVDIDDEMDGPEVIHPYEVEAGALPPPPDSDSDPEDEIVPTGSSVASCCKVFSPDPLGKDVNALHYKVKSLAKQMSIQAETEFSNLKRLGDVEQYMKEFDSDLKDEMQSRNKLERNMTTLEDQVRDLVHKEREEKQEVEDGDRRPRDATTIPVAHLDLDDPYVSAATGVPIIHEEIPSPELRGSPRDSQ